MNITGTQFAYYHLCHRKLWLFSQGIQMEQFSELVADGKLVHETTYLQRPEKYTELQIGGIKIDFYDATNKVIHETKRTNAVEEVHEWQLKYYLYVLHEQGVPGATGIVEYPKLREKKQVILTDEDASDIVEALVDIERLVQEPVCPDRINRKLCQKCAYFDFCYADEG